MTSGELLNRLELPKTIRGILQPPEDLTVSEWCDKHRYINRRYAATPGRWKTSHTPYLREPFDAFVEPGVQQIIFIKCSRVGGTEWLNNCLAYTIDARPVPVMFVQPEKGGIEDEFSGRIRTMIEDSAKLADHAPDPRCFSSHFITLDTLDIHGAWAENPRTMIRKTIGLAMFDEIDNCERASGGLGNTLKVLLERLVTFGYRGKLIADGTPTTKEASGWQLLEQSDYRKPHVPCPYCGTYQVLSFDRIKLRDDAIDERDPEKIEREQLAGYVCALDTCEKWIEHKKWHRWMIDRVVWVPRGCSPAEVLDVENAELVAAAMACGPPGSRGHVQWKPRLDGEAPITKVRGYWISVLYSPWSSRTWSHILAEFLRVKDKRESLRVFKNSWLAEPWEEAVEATSFDLLVKRRAVSTYDKRVVPAEAKMLLFEADVQGDHIWYSAHACGVGERSWLVDEGRIEAPQIVDPDGEQLVGFDLLYHIAFHTCYPIAGDRDGRLMRAYALGIDSGYGQRIDEVYQFGRRPGVYVFKGVQSGDYSVKPTKIEYQPKGGLEPFSLRLFLVNTGLFKGKAHRMAKIEPGQPGAWHIPRDVGDEYLRQFTAEHQVWERPTGKKGGKAKLVWKPRTEGAANHQLDTRVYDLALAELCRVPLLREHSERLGVMAGAMDPPPAPEVKPKPKPGSGRRPGGPPGGGWFGGSR